MPKLEELIMDSMDIAINKYSKSKYNIAVGFFEGYPTGVEADSSGNRFCNLKLHYKDENGNDISAGRVPLLYIGSQNFIVDYQLSAGDQLLVLFSDRTLEQWKDKDGAIPQKLRNPVKDSINHALAIPIVSHHKSNLITTSDLPSGVGGRIGVKSGQKVQIGNDSADLLKLTYDAIDNLIIGGTSPPTDGDTFWAFWASTVNPALELIKTTLETITKV